jgi:hypothetical protein
VDIVLHKEMASLGQDLIHFGTFHIDDLTRRNGICRCRLKGQINVGCRYANPTYGFGFVVGCRYANPTYGFGFVVGCRYANPTYGFGFVVGCRYANPTYGFGFVVGCR